MTLDTTKAQKKLRAVATALGLCNDCEHHITAAESTCSPATEASGSEQEQFKPSTPPGTPPQAPVPDLPSNDITWLHSNLTSVRSIDSGFQACTIKNCELEGVTFKFCHFSNVIFQDLRLKNVTFFNVDFQNVRLHDVQLEDLVWSSECLANALLGPWDFRKTVFGRNVLTVRAKEKTTLTRTESHVAKVRAELLHEAGTFGMRSLGVVLKEVDLFQLPQSVLAKVVQEEILPVPGPGEEQRIMMIDRPVASLRRPTGQTTYTIKSPFGYQNPPSTYRPSLHSSSSSMSDEDEDTSTRHSAISITFASKRCWRTSIRALYHRIFHFSSPEACLAFLHDHQMPAYTPVGISLIFTSQTNPAAWKRLFDIIVLERLDIKEIHLEISAEFWTTTHWMSQASPRQVLQTCYMTAWPFVGRTFLQHVSRIQGRRLSGLGGQPATEAEHVRFMVNIEKAKGYPSREAFVDELQLFVREEMLRTFVIKKVVKRECCGIRKLEECCYWKLGEEDY